MTTENKEIKVKKEIKDLEKETFVKLSDLTDQDVDKLPLAMVHFKKNTFKNGNSSVSMKFVLNDLFDLELNSMQKNSRFNETRFKNIILKVDPKLLLDNRGKVVSEFNLPCKYRFVKGKNTTGQTYYSLELIFKRYVYETIFISRGHEMENVDMLEKAGYIKPNWFERPDVLDVAETSNFDFD
ncbi:MAG: hypothetical protein M0R46_16245 [Candidatus Muirbacterium halophilum]|nr:hypothetical protein [Candidatus Muirbacterium halophilum]MCK9477468.1 hypothetical protein [Candidatus Muirbacterium halophilum]